MSLPRPRMVYNLKEGFESNGLPAGKRDLREPEKNVESEVFKDPLSLVISIVKLIFMIVYAPIMEVIKSLTVQPKSLRGKVCFVTGSGRGLGRGICIALAREGAIIACADINEEANSKTVEILTEMGAKAKAYKLNVADKSQVEALAKRVELELGRVYLLVNNAAIVMPPPKVSEDYVKAVFGVNTFGAIWTIGAFLPKMKELNDGHIVIISSVGAAIGVPVMSSYCASKAALSTYSQAIWLNLVQEGYDNVFLTTVHPWIMNTSADYVDSLKSRIKATEVEDVEKLVISAIKYNKSEVSTHPFLFFLFSISRFIPRGIVIAVSELMNIRGTVPNVKEYKDLYVSDIINESNKTTEKKKDS